MYYLAKFCRICIRTGGELKDIDSKDYDSIKLSEKLKVISRESLSTQICSSCISKLRVSYQFHTMCRKSTTILQQYLTELLSMSDDAASNKLRLSELHVDIPSESRKPRRKRVGKDERCSLLRKLLSKVTKDQIMHNIHIHGLTKLCNTIIPTETEARVPVVKEPTKKVKSVNSGGLKSLLKFTKNFDFGYDINLVIDEQKNVDLTPLEQLAKFTKNFFCDHFIDYRENIINISETLDSDCSDDETMFDHCEEAETIHVKEEIVMVEPSVSIKQEYVDESDNSAYHLSSPLVQACYDNETQVKEEFDSAQCKVETSGFFDDSYLRHSNYLEQMQNFTEHFKTSRTLSPYSVKCRTRGNPFINPQLKKQFLTRNFKCSTCNRKFKSQGYLKAHCTRLHH
ncbi:uncharacterized protein LOC116172828 isoform X2 [Photinus pyralis]|uniref:Uncharacterized protein n=1 Tax=Photinus pyralis TaxID=7054 RepID=A0A1Y1NGG0_PHOPY|nr:uncharacterized protein LOC116172828 isoform X2 [Photinus pyralis]